MALTPMMQQYLDIKQGHPDALLMFRLGDFYELFFEDAETASRVLDITLTGRDAGTAGRIPMCGVPYHAADQYISRLVDHGYCVAICEQTEDPKQAKGLVRREVVRIVTPGTTLRDEGISNRFLASIVHRNRRWGLSCVDVSTGEVWCSEFDDEKAVESALTRWTPAEVLVYERMEETNPLPWLRTLSEATPFRLTRRPEPRSAAELYADTVRRQYDVVELGAIGLADFAVAAEAVGLVLAYIEDTQKVELRHFRTPQQLETDAFLVLDNVALRHLELLETNRTRSRKGSLLALLDETRTAMGSRLLRRWLERPLAEKSEIEARLDAVENLVEDLFLRSLIQDEFKHVYDLERLLGRVSFGSASGRDLVAIAKSLRCLPRVSETLRHGTSRLLRSLADELPDFTSLCQLIEETLVDEPPVSVREGGLIRPGVDSELDELREVTGNSKAWLAALEQRERERTGIKNLKIGFNKVFGYYLEVSKGNVGLVPPEYERRQTLANGERYIIPELKERESLILNSEERATNREFELFTSLRQQLLREMHQIQKAAQTVAVIDSLTSLAVVSAMHRFIRPTLQCERGIRIRQGRHPVVEAAHPGKFVPNDVEMGEHSQLILITGPNMAGKSTFMRQTAIIVIMAHMGCFVPAEAAEIGLVDRVFTRIGASDDLGAGQSTFMVEMVELAHILRSSTSRSLVLLDEIGRGTSTYDGLSIAEAVIEALQKPGQNPLTLFATHYHELTETVTRLPNAKNASVLVQERGDEVTFLHTVVDRPADKSYGIQVARLAGIPKMIIARATELLQMREDVRGNVAGLTRLADALLFAHPTGAEAPEADSPPLKEPGEEGNVGVQPVADLRETAVTHADALPLFQGLQHEANALPLFEGLNHEIVDRLSQVDVLNLTPIQAIAVLNDLVAEAKRVTSWVK